MSHCPHGRRDECDECNDPTGANRIASSVDMLHAVLDRLITATEAIGEEVKSVRTMLLTKERERIAVGLRARARHYRATVDATGVGLDLAKECEALAGVIARGEF